MSGLLTEPDAEKLVEQIHAKPGKVCIVVTGAGTQALAWLFGQGGASRTVLDAQIPYSVAAVDLFAGRKPDQYVSGTAAVLLAQKALERAKELAVTGSEPPETLLAGVACTAAIATDRHRRGENRCHVAYMSSDGRGKLMSLTMNKGARERSGEEDVTSRIILNAVAEAKYIPGRVKLPLLDGETLETGSPEDMNVSIQ